MAKPPLPESPNLRILEIAADHIRKYGLRRTTIVGIAQDAGMSHANVYRYFPSKTALIEAVTDIWLKPVEADLRQIADSPDPAYDKLERIVSTLHTAYRDKLENDPNVFSLFVDATSDGLAVARRHRNRVQAELQRILDEGNSAGAFVLPDQRKALSLVFDGLHRFIHPVSVCQDAGTPRAQLEPRFERMVRLVIGALGRHRI